MMEFIRLDLSGQANEADIGSATHVSIEYYRTAAAQAADMKAKNKVLHAKLQRQINNKINWRKRAEEAAAAGTPPPRGRPKREIVARNGRYWSVLLVELDAQTEQDALEEALEYIREECREGRLYRIQDPGTGCWVAEIERPMTQLITWDQGSSVR